MDADFATALRGYDRVAVDEYVRQTRRLVAELQATRSPEAAVRRALERVGEQISGILQRAHETAEQITAQSRSEAEDRLEQARLEAAHLTNAAEQQVRDLDADTDRIWVERQRIVADAEDLAGQLMALARSAGERFPADAEAAAAAGTVAFPGPDAEAEGYAEADEDDFDAEDQLGADAEGGHDEEEPDDAAAAEDAAAPQAEPDERSEVERTVAFAPLEPEHDRPAAAQGSTDDDATAVIPPASQAANRRTNK
ncbi:MAG TPA: DivIVA domain-containing protein [Solirubrobacteraceae bacterium]|nr:DivIVA domain-containing protein [Solirubrobacteraceae bacterium]